MLNNDFTVQSYFILLNSFFLRQHSILWTHFSHLRGWRKETQPYVNAEKEFMFHPAGYVYMHGPWLCDPTLFYNLTLLFSSFVYGIFCSLIILHTHTQHLYSHHHTHNHLYAATTTFVYCHMFECFVFVYCIRWVLTTTSDAWLSPQSDISWVSNQQVLMWAPVCRRWMHVVGFFASVHMNCLCLCVYTHALHLHARLLCTNVSIRRS